MGYIERLLSSLLSFTFQSRNNNNNNGELAERNADLLFQRRSTTPDSLPDGAGV